MKPISVSEYLKVHNIPEDLAKSIIEVYNAERKYLNYSCCNICDKELSDKDKMEIDAHHFLIVCIDHKEYGPMYMKDIARRTFRIRACKPDEEDIRHVKNLHSYWNMADSKLEDPIAGIATHFGTTKEIIKNILK